MSAAQALRSMPHTASLGLQASIRERLRHANEVIVPQGKARAQDEVRRAKENHAKQQARAAIKRPTSTATEPSLSPVLESRMERVTSARAQQGSTKHAGPIFDLGKTKRLQHGQLSAERYTQLAEKKAGLVDPALESRMQTVLCTRASQLGAAAKRSGVFFSPERLARLNKSGMSPKTYVEIAEKRLGLGGTP